MTAEDLLRVETALDIRLPSAYRELVAPFPIPAYAGNTDTELWDDPNALIELNRKLRAGDCRTRAWPVHMFALGRDNSGCANAIDLRDPLAPVLWADRCHLDAVGSGQESPSLAAWVTERLAEWRVDLEERNISPDGSPEERQKADEKSARADGMLMLAVAGVSLAIVIVAWLAVRFLAP